MSNPLGRPTKGHGDKAPPQSSAPMNTAVGSGSRPGSGRYPIEDSSPGNNHTLDRNPPSGWLGSGSTRQQGS